LPPAVFDSWVRPCRLLAVEGDHLRIGAPNPFSRDWLAQHHLDALQHAAQEVVGGHPRVTVVVDEAATTESAPAVTSPRGGGAVAKLNEEQLLTLAEIVAKQPDATLEELRRQLQRQVKLEVSLSTVWRGLERIEFTQKKDPLGARG